MQIPVEVTFRDMPVSDAVEARCWTEVEKLERHFDRIIACQVTIAEARRHHQQGQHFQVRINLSVPWRELVVNRDPANGADEDIDVAIGDAFERMRRQLVSYAQKLPREVKKQENGAV